MEDIFGNDLGNTQNGHTSDNYGKVGPQRIEDQIGKKIEESKEYRKPLYGSGPPSYIPRFIGDVYCDTTNDTVYISFGTEVSDWLIHPTSTYTGSFEDNDGWMIRVINGLIVSRDEGRLLMESEDFILLQSGDNILLE